MALTNSRTSRPTLFKLSTIARVTTTQKCYFCGHNHRASDHVTTSRGRINTPPILCK